MKRFKPIMRHELSSALVSDILDEMDVSGSMPGLLPCSAKRELWALYKCVLRNALTSTLMVIGFEVQLLLSGAIVVETIFFWAGIGLSRLEITDSLMWTLIIPVTHKVSG
jgi:ABC-type microcin C transport system permease subunit YejB